LKPGGRTRIQKSTCGSAHNTYKETLAFCKIGGLGWGVVLGFFLGILSMNVA